LTKNGKVLCSFHNPAVTTGFTRAAETIEFIFYLSELQLFKEHKKVLSRALLLDQKKNRKFRRVGSMKKYYLLAISLAFVLMIATVPAMAQSKSTTPGENPNVSWTLLTPSAGVVLKAGSQVLVTWDMTLDREFIANEWAEMEYVLETGEGVNMRITPQMTVDKRSFTWTVPNLNTTTARLVLQCGIEGEGEQYRFVQGGTFTIKAARTDPYILINSLRGNMNPGQNLDISWTSNLPAGTPFDVMVSFNRGAHFHKAGTTTDTRFAFPVEADFAGAITVQIVGARPDGRKVQSLLTRDATVRVTDSTNY
jgi:hypothetical protein